MQNIHQIYIFQKSFLQKNIKHYFNHIQIYSPVLIQLGKGVKTDSEGGRPDKELFTPPLESDLAVTAVGGGVRNHSGHWQTGCYQATLAYYRLQVL